MNGRREAIIRLLMLAVMVLFVIVSAVALKISLFDNAEETAGEVYERTGGVIGEPNAQGESLNVIVADTEEKRTLGLSGRGSLLDNSVMLFVFPQPDFYGIWMKDMKFAIDIFWLDENFTVIDLKTAVSPETYPEIFYPGAKAKYVLEGNAGFAEKRGIRIDSVLKFLK